MLRVNGKSEQTIHDYKNGSDKSESKQSQCQRSEYSDVVNFEKESN